jgi:hypothetical protein
MFKAADRTQVSVFISFCCRTLFDYIYWRSVSQYWYQNSVVRLVPNQFMKSSNFWDMAPCISLKVIRYFEGKFRFHLQGEIISPARESVKEFGKQNSDSLHNHSCGNLKSYIISSYVLFIPRSYII